VLCSGSFPHRVYFGVQRQLIHKICCIKNSLIKRKQNDGKALFELDTNLRKLDKEDSVKYDFALFGLGVFEGF
jgi:hypothetical protein